MNAKQTEPCTGAGNVKLPDVALNVVWANEFESDTMETLSNQVVNCVLACTGGVPEIPSSLKPSNKSTRDTKPVPEGSRRARMSMAPGRNVFVFSRVMAGDTSGRCRSSQNIVKALGMRRKEQTFHARRNTD